MAEEPEDFKWLEWGLAQGTAARIHKLKNGMLPGCARYAPLDSDRQGIGIALATKLFPDNMWCSRCASEVCAFVAQ